MTSLVAQMVKCLPTIRETQIQSLVREDLEKEMVTHSSILAWKIPGTKKPGRLQAMGSQRVGNDLTLTFSRKHKITSVAHSKFHWIVLL